MARKRLTPAKTEFLNASDAPLSDGTATSSRAPLPPIAQVAAEASAAHALQDLAKDMETLRQEGRVILKLPLSDIAMDHLARDRARAEPEAFGELVRSIQDHGQRMPIEVTLLSEPTKDGAKYGLISGWRRMSALEHLHTETGEAQYANVLALLRQPKDSAEAYVAMVEENEIRVGLSYYERAGIALEATRRGVFETHKQALQSLYSSASRAKRSRIKAFMDLHTELGEALRFPTAIPERFGLQLIYAMRQMPGLADFLRQNLQQENAVNEEAEMDRLEVLVGQYQKRAGQDVPTPSKNVPHAEQQMETLPSGLVIKRHKGKIEITGAGVNDALFERLRGILG